MLLLIRPPPMKGPARTFLTFVKSARQGDPFNAWLSGTTTSRMLSQNANAKRWKAVVVGAGPAGLAAVGNLVEGGQVPILWVDPTMRGGRLDKYYRYVPSNTKVKRFMDYARGVQTFKDVAAEIPEPNALTRLEDMNQEETCHIAQAADLCNMLIRGLTKRRGVEKRKDRLLSASYSELGWKINLKDKRWSEQIEYSDMLVLCTGSSPTSDPLPVSHLKEIGLDPSLNPSELMTHIPENTPVTIAVIGASHSAILVLRNLWHVASLFRPDLKVKWFTRHPLRYAEERDGWIYRDNTGLKGDVATWAKDSLEEDKLPHSLASKYIQKISTTRETEQEDYEKHLGDCTYVIQAIGYKPDELPLLTKDGTNLDLKYDNETGGFKDQDGNVVNGLHGAGIAFPERVTDPEGNVEYAVGLAKFMKFLKRVVPEWISASSAAI